MRAKIPVLRSRSVRKNVHKCQISAKYTLAALARMAHIGHHRCQMINNWRVCELINKNRLKHILYIYICQVV